MVDEALASSPEAQAEARDAAAFPKVVAAHHDDMARVAFVVIGLPRPAQDAVEATWARVWQERQSLEQPDAIRPWLLAMAVREARRFADAGFGQSQDGGGDAGAPVSQAAAAPAYRSDELVLARALSKLDAHDRMILGLRWVGGLHSEQIGRLLAMPGNAVLARVARILDTWLKDPDFAAQPTVKLEDYERELAGRLRTLADRAVMPIKAAVVAQMAIDTIPPPSVATQLETLLRRLLDRQGGIGRLGGIDRRVVAALGGVAAVFFAFTLFSRGGGGVAIVTPVPTDARTACLHTELQARVTGWQATGSERVGSVEVTNPTEVACLLDGAPEPWLIDATGNPVLKGQDLPALSVRLGPRETLRTRIHVANYCGPAPLPPVSVAFRSGTNIIPAAALEGSDNSGVPPCTSNGPAVLWMEAWGS